MINDHRSSHGDRQTAWARICGEFDEIQNRATLYGCERRLETLVENTRRGDRRMVLWDGLLGEIAARAADARRTTWRDPDPVAGAWPSPLDSDNSGFACPDGLCNRRAAASFGERPRCALLALVMTDLSQDVPGSAG